MMDYLKSSPFFRPSGITGILLLMKAKILTLWKLFSLLKDCFASLRKLSTWKGIKAENPQELIQLARA